MNQYQFSDKLGITRAALSHYERGFREPSLTLISSFADTLGVSCDYLLGRTSVPGNGGFRDE
ncbi:helix-turn-helix transcriptional regulator [Paenibacillus sp. RUD330]|uniref:helix-turn-helix domain-containing protein n=1 Tax=Paenibacillus sp. RUD330 TaxID=2023772 RepID=UPI001F0F8A08|nr:helix-turn-helix transcriptional regulator [Paenibacillus sp. RUD330]